MLAARQAGSCRGICNPAPVGIERKNGDGEDPSNTTSKTTTRWKRKSFVTAGKTWLVIQKAHFIRAKDTISTVNSTPEPIVWVRWG
jgi:hypothetical protein